MIDAKILSKIFLILCHQKHKQQNKKTDELNFIKIKNIYAKDTIKKVVRQPKKQEKMFINHKSNKGLVPRIYKQYLQLKINKPPTLF